MSDYDYTVNINQMAELFGRSVKTIGDWINHGMPTLGRLRLSKPSLTVLIMDVLVRSNISLAP